MNPLPGGRRHSISNAALPTDKTDEAHKNKARERTSPPHDPAATAPSAKGVFHGLFRRHSDAGRTAAGVAPMDQGSSQNKHRHDSLREKRDGSHAHDHDRRSDSHHSSDTREQTSTNTKPKASKPDTYENSPGDKGKPRQQPSKAKPEDTSNRKFTDAEKDLRALFSGAPYFFLEKGKYGQWHPQIVFPWDDHNPSIQSMWDRRLLPHSSYTLATLHAHLPVPEGWAVKSDTPSKLSAWKGTTSPKRGTFDIEVYEVPNMLSMNGIEPGSIGFRHFLELPVADSVRYVGPETPKQRPETRQLATMSATEAYDLMERYSEPYSECDDGTVHNRKMLLCDGPTAWRRIGVRDVHLKTVTERLETLRRIRHEALYESTDKTILDVESPRELYNMLFNKFLHPPPRFIRLDNADPHDLKSQIKVLATTLATPGAWFNFSFPEWRFRAGQVLWQASPHLDGDCLEPNSCGDLSRRPWIDSGLERKWFLLQMLLAGELLLRLDAVARLVALSKSDDLAISQQDLNRFDSIRKGKVNWDLIVVRRFFDSFSIGLGSPSDASLPLSPEGKPNEKHHRLALFKKLARRVPTTANQDAQSAWECKLVPVNIQKQLAGLAVFAENIGWPGLDTIKSCLESTIGDGDLAQASSNMYSEPVHQVLPGDGNVRLGREDMYSRSPSRRLVFLNASNSREESSSKGIGGWITRSWLSGFIVPGKGINRILMATVLECDAEAINTLGPVANLFGGFSYKGRSWWSKECIVGRVLASMDNTKLCLGWSSSTVLPRAASTAEVLENTWFDILVRDPPTRPKEHRIKEGHKLVAHSTPLGVGKMTPEVFTLPVDQALPADSNTAVNFRALTFNPNEEQSEDMNIVVSKETSIIFDLCTDSKESATTVSFPLMYNVQFIASHECCPPFGRISHHSDSSDSGQDQEFAAQPREHTRLPGHPLHKYYTFKYIPLHSLPETPGPEKSAVAEGSASERHYEVIVIDARGCPNKETFARAWCASVGFHAIIGRVERTCLACCIREAHATKARVVIRVGDADCNRPSPINEIRNEDNKLQGKSAS